VNNGIDGIFHFLWIESNLRSANCFLLYWRKKMIRILLFLLALILLICSYYLIKKPQGFLVLFSEDTQTESRSFLRQFGYIYALLGIIGLVIGFLNQRTYSMIYLIVLLVVAALFALLMGSKTKKG
jgi:cell division protein FtsW (lipid II flippase)